MTHYGTWVAYGGSGRTALAIVLVAVAAGVTYAGLRLPLPVRLPRPGNRAGAVLLIAWGTSIVAFLACLAVYVDQAGREFPSRSVPADPITPVTAVGVAAIFVTVIIVGRSRGEQGPVASAVIGAMAAPMIFELPFDLIVMARTYPPIPPDPALYRIIFFAPLFLIELTTLSLLSMSAMVRLTRPAFFAVALMLLVFALWALSGFAYPATPLPFALNVLSKILAFIAAISLYLPIRAAATAPGPAVSPPPA